MRNSNIQTWPRRPLGLVAAMGLAFTVAGCGGGGGEDTVDPSLDPTARLSTLEYFTEVVDAGFLTLDGSGLYALPPSQPTAVDAIDSDAAFGMLFAPGFAPRMVIAAASVTETAVSGLHVESVVYPRADGTLWRVATELGGATPEPVQVSSANQLQRACFRSNALQMGSLTAQSVYADSNAAPVVYALRPASTTCDDAADAGSLTWHFVLAGDSATTDPRAFPVPFSADVRPRILNLFDAERDHAGWLIRQDNGLTRVAADGTVVQTNITAITDSFLPVIPQLSSGILLLGVDDRLVAFNPVDNTVTELTTDDGLSIENPQAATDGVVAYVLAPDGLYRTIDGGRELVKVDGGDPDLNAGPFVGKDAVVWVRDTDVVAETLRSVAKSATDVGTGKDIGTYPEEDFPIDAINSSQWLYYTQSEDTGGSTLLSAVAMRLDGSESKVFANARWAGYTLASQRVLGDGGSISHVYRAKGVTGPDDAGETLLSVPAGDPTNLAAAINLGVIPDGFNVTFPGFGPGRLASSEIAGEVGIWYFNDSKAGSLQEVLVEFDKPFPLPLF